MEYSWDRVVTSYSIILSVTIFGFLFLQKPVGFAGKEHSVQVDNMFRVPVLNKKEDNQQGPHVVASSLATHPTKIPSLVRPTTWQFLSLQLGDVSTLTRRHGYWGQRK